MLRSRGLEWTIVFEPKITTHTELNIDMGGKGGVSIPLKPAWGSNILSMYCPWPLFLFRIVRRPGVAHRDTSGRRPWFPKDSFAGPGSRRDGFAGRGSQMPYKSTSGPQWPHNGLTMASQWPLVISQVAPTICLIQKDSLTFIFF